MSGDKNGCLNKLELCLGGGNGRMYGEKRRRITESSDYEIRENRLSLSQPDSCVFLRSAILHAIWVEVTSLLRLLKRDIPRFYQQHIDSMLSLLRKDFQLIKKSLTCCVGSMKDKSKIYDINYSYDSDLIQNAHSLANNLNRISVVLSNQQYTSIMNQEIIQSADVIFCTLVMAGNAIVKRNVHKVRISTVTT